MKKYVIAICLMLCLAGCISIKTAQIDSTKEWEGHYFNIKDFRNATSNIKLEKNESIWVLSDRTLNRVLKNVEKK